MTKKPKDFLQEIKPLDRPLKDLSQNEREKWRYGEYDRKYIQKWKQNQKQKGLCLECKQPSLRRNLCKKHLQKRLTQEKQNLKKWRQIHKQKGLCPHCKKPTYKWGLCQHQNEYTKQYRKTTTKNRKP